MPTFLELEMEVNDATNSPRGLHERVSRASRALGVGRRHDGTASWEHDLLKKRRVLRKVGVMHCLVTKCKGAMNPPKVSDKDYINFLIATPNDDDDDVDAGTVS